MKTYVIVTLSFRNGRELMAVPDRQNQTSLLPLEVVLISSRWGVQFLPSITMSAHPQESLALCCIQG